MKNKKKMQISRLLAKSSIEMLEIAKEMGDLTTREDRKRQQQLIKESNKQRDWSREYAEGVV